MVANGFVARVFHYFIKNCEESPWYFSMLLQYKQPPVCIRVNYILAVAFFRIGKEF